MSTFEVRDTRSGFLWINNEVVDQFAAKIGASAFLVYAVIARHANNSSIAFPSQSTIATLSGLSERAVRTALTSLRDNKLISWDQVKGEGKKYVHNRYTLLKLTAEFAASSENPRQDSTETTGSQLPTNKTKSEQEEHLRAVCWLADQYKTIFNKKQWTLTPKRKDKALSRLKECLSRSNGSMHHAVGMMVAAMKALRASEWHMGNNDRNTQFIDWENNLYKSAEQTEKWIEKGLHLKAQDDRRAVTSIDSLAAMRARREAKRVR